MRSVYVSSQDAAIMKTSPYRFALRRWLQAASIALVLANGLAIAAEPSFDAWSDGFAEEWVRMNPLLATRSQYFTGEEQDALNRQLALYTVFGQAVGTEAAAAQAALARRGLAELERFRVQELNAVQRTSAALIRWTMQDVISQAGFATHRLVFQQMQDGLHLEYVNALTQVHPIQKRHDVENYLARLRQLGARLDEGIAAARGAEAAGVVAPRFILEKTIGQLDDFLAAPAASNVLVASLAERIGAMSEPLPEPERAASVREAARIVEQQVIPAFRRIRDLLSAELPKSTDDAGVWRLPRGDEFYARQLAHFTTTRLGASEVHQIGLHEVARIEAEMDKLLRELGFNTGTLQERIEALNASMRPKTEDPRPILMSHVEAAMRDAGHRSQSIFGLQPKAPVVLRREPPLSEASAAAHYTPPAPDGSRPGIYWLPLADIGPRVTWLGSGLKSTAFHEAVPGHHFQLAIQQESATLPKYRKLGAFGFISAYGEGWALYAERLADENGWYADDPRGRLGYLNLQLFRARRLVVDTGIHAMRWTRQQAIDYGFTPAEVERYIVWPGQACSYMIGQLRIVELRERARAALGGRFSIKAFHDLVLGLGNVPLDVLAGEVDAWIAEQTGTGSEKLPKVATG
jgi:uncharacterized protein (DUF885 family)